MTKLPDGTVGLTEIPYLQVRVLIPETAKSRVNNLVSTTAQMILDCIHIVTNIQNKGSLIGFLRSLGILLCEERVHSSHRSQLVLTAALICARRCSCMSLLSLTLAMNLCLLKRQCHLANGLTCTTISVPLLCSGRVGTGNAFYLPMRLLYAACQGNPGKVY